MRAATYLNYADEAGNKIFRKGLVSVHGMWTTGPWQDDISLSLQVHRILHRPVNLGYLVARVVLPRTSRKAADKIGAAYEEIRQHKVRVSAIAHSFGSLALGTTLRIKPDVQFERIALYGSILTPRFEWSYFVDRQQVSQVLVETCPRDHVVKLARLLPGPTGPSGCVGFTDTAGGAVHTCRHQWTGHTNLGTKLHCEETWIPFILNGTIPPG